MTIKDENDRLMKRIKHCLAMASSSNENEAATALRQATNMMKKHGISEEDMLMADITYSTSNTKLPRTAVPSYICRLSGMVARMFGCKHYYKYDYESDKYKACYVGSNIHAEIASYAFDVLSSQLKDARKLYLKNDLRRVRIKKNKYSRADRFCMGWVKGVELLVGNITPPKADIKLIEQKMQSDLGALSVTKTSNTGSNAPRTGSVDDYMQGYIASDDAELHTAVGADEAKAMIEQDMAI
ncbi:MAG: DUF2786 domain-containing protein [Psychrobacter sp.]|uniref:DUF2786 domain-containing protein n=1 Tax=Psychrobacter sp. TaxID=56811 RepID=UPI002648FF7B|nr:DUF2786 domain-containing protein [Psychrobacter sp.]MDN5619690.1 DUF2786 domain-containing protein [Psychrobacter sp.]